MKLTCPKPAQLDALLNEIISLEIFKNQKFNLVYLPNTSEFDLEFEVNPNTSGTVIMWEAYEAKTMKQVKLLEDTSPRHLDNHHTVRRMIHQGEFRDGTNIISTSSDASYYLCKLAYSPSKTT